VNECIPVNAFSDQVSICGVLLMPASKEKTARVTSFEYHATVGPDEIAAAIQLFYGRNINHGLQNIFDSSPGIPVKSYVGRAKFVLSSQPSTNTTFIVDDYILVNGRIAPGFSRLTGNPSDPASIGRSPQDCYEGVLPLDITSEVRSDGLFFFHLWNAGGGPFCNTPIWLRILRP
jgi:hypothetical protein